MFELNIALTCSPREHQCLELILHNTIDITCLGEKQNGELIASNACEKTLTPADLASKYLEKNGNGVPSGVLLTFADEAIKSQSNGPILAHIL